MTLPFRLIEIKQLIRNIEKIEIRFSPEYLPPLYTNAKQHLSQLFLINFSNWMKTSAFIPVKCGTCPKYAMTEFFNGNQTDADQLILWWILLTVIKSDCWKVSRVKWYSLFVEKSGKIKDPPLKIAAGSPSIATIESRQ